MHAIDRMAEMIRISPVENKISFECIETFNCGAYVRKRIEYTVNGRNIPAFLLIPNGDGPFPAVLINHQHIGNYILVKVKCVALKGIRYKPLAQH